MGLFSGDKIEIKTKVLRGIGLGALATVFGWIATPEGAAFYSTMADKAPWIVPLLSLLGFATGYTSVGQRNPEK